MRARPVLEQAFLPFSFCFRASNPGARWRFGVLLLSGLGAGSQARAVPVRHAQACKEAKRLCCLGLRPLHRQTMRALGGAGRGGDGGRQGVHATAYGKVCTRPQVLDGRAGARRPGDALKEAERAPLGQQADEDGGPQTTVISLELSLFLQNSTIPPAAVWTPPACLPCLEGGPSSLLPVVLTSVSIRSSRRCPCH